MPPKQLHQPVLPVVERDAARWCDYFQAREVLMARGISASEVKHVLDNCMKVVREGRTMYLIRDPVVTVVDIAPDLE